MEGKEVFFSIVIPTYNRASYIGTTLRSLLSSEYTSFEIIVVDDGGTDNTESVVKELGDARVNYFRKTNAERGAARNYGAGLAKGEYINFFDSDDIAYPNHLAEANAAAHRLRNPEVFHLGYDVKDGEGKWMRNVDNLPQLLNDRLIEGNYLSCNGVFLRSDISHQFPFSELRALSASEDYELWLRLASRFPFYGVNVITSTVVNHDARSVLRINRDSFLQRIGLLQENLAKDSMFVKRYGPYLKTFRAYLNIYMALHLAMADYSRKLSFQFLFKAVALSPRVLVTRRFLAALKNIVL